MEHILIVKCLSFYINLFQLILNVDKLLKDGVVFLYDEV